MLPDYWLLLALVFAGGFAALILQQARSQSDPSQSLLGSGLLALALLLGIQIGLRFELNETLVKLFYWGRGMLLVAWLGHGYTNLVLPGNSLLRKLTPALLAVSAVALGPALSTQLTQAQTWYAPAQPIYSQLGDLLATNRPTRWLALALNLYGLATVGAGLWLTRSQGAPNLWAGLLALLALGLLAFAWAVPSPELPRLYALELMPPFLLFAAWRLRQAR
ncbi:MAG: hypothetical protein KIT46_01710 [Anaerolineales bacterium]|nr:hypothetical protein [Anaerolineales bacterium]MCW5854740.1 hypothetical protein [Anaerolineales bacterium]